MDTCVCAACGNPAPLDSYRCSQIGAATLNYCRACAVLGAESASVVKELIGDPENVADWVLVYDSESDWYRYYRDGAVRDFVETKVPGEEVTTIKTRKDLNEFLDKHQAREAACPNQSPKTPE